MALASLLLALLVAPLVLATHVVIARSSPRLVALWLFALVGLMALSVALAAVQLLLALSGSIR
jgi:hypothetical protein